MAQKPSGAETAARSSRISTLSFVFSFPDFRPQSSQRPLVFRAPVFTDRDRAAIPARWTLALAALAIAWLASGCDGIEEIRTRYTPATPREAYERALGTSGLARSAMGRSWHRTAAEVLVRPAEPGTPYREVGFFDPAETPAGAFRVPLKRGQRLIAEAMFARPDSGRIFLDLFREMSDPAIGIRRVASSDSTQILSFDATASASYILRIQPELLAGGLYELQIRTEASVVFPVSGKDSRAIQSVFGDPRDAGRRSHHGVDIFAPRGTPVVAAVDGVISSTRVGGLGGL